MSNITSDNCNEVFLSMLSHSISLCIISLPRVSPPSPEAASYEKMPNWIVWLRGCSSVLIKARSHLKPGPLATVTEQGTKVTIATAGDTRFSEDEDTQA